VCPRLSTQSRLSTTAPPVVETAFSGLGSLFSRNSCNPLPSPYVGSLIPASKPPLPRPSCQIRPCESKTRIPCRRPSWSLLILTGLDFFPIPIEALFLRCRPSPPLPFKFLHASGPPDAYKTGREFFLFWSAIFARPRFNLNLARFFCPFSCCRSSNFLLSPPDMASVVPDSNIGRAAFFTSFLLSFLS